MPACMNAAHLSVASKEQSDVDSELVSIDGCMDGWITMHLDFQYPST